MAKLERLMVTALATSHDALDSGDAKIEREIPNPPPRPSWRSLPRSAPFEARRRWVLNAVAANRRARLRVVDGGKTTDVRRPGTIDFGGDG